MKLQKITITATMLLFYVSSFAQFKADGTPDMRYSSNKKIYGSGYSYSYNPSKVINTTINYPTSTVNSNYRSQNSYIKNNGTVVSSHYKTVNNNTNWDNYSTSGNINPFTGNKGYRAKDYSVEANNYGAGKVIHQGSRGGQFYINSNGNKTYVPKRNFPF